MTKKDNKKELYIKLKDFCSIAQIACFVYAFFCVFYWFLKLAEFPFIKGVAFLFEPVFSTVKLFYVQKTLDAGKTDLAGIIACVIFILFSVLARIARDKISEKEEEHDIAMRKKRKEDDLQAQKLIQQEYFTEMRKYNKFIILVDLNIQQIKSYIFDDTVKEDDLKTLKVSIMAELFNAIKSDYVIQKSKYENDSFYIMGLLQNAPECINTITSTIRELSKKYSHLNITLSHDISFDAVSDQTNIQEKLEFLKKVIQLHYSDSILTTSLFKTCYEMVTKSQLNFTVLGSFQFVVGGKPCTYELHSVRKKN